MLIQVVKSCFNDPTELTGFIPYLRTCLNLLNSPGSHRTLRELPRQLHHATAFPRAIRQCYTSHDPPTTLLYLVEALGTRGHEAGARGRENQVKNLPSGDPITYRILRLASTPLPPRTTATINVHIYCRLVHAVNGTLLGRQQVNDHPWPPTPTQLQQWRSGLLSILPYLDDLHEMKSANWAVAIHEYLISGVQQCQEHVKAVVTGVATCKTIFLTGCVSTLGVNVRDDRPNVSRRLTASTFTFRTPPSDNHVLRILQELLRVSKEQREVIELQTNLLQRKNNILQLMDRRLHRLEEQFELTARRTVMTRSRRSMSEWHTSEPKEQRKRGRKEEGDEKKRKEEAKKRKEEEEEEQKRKEEEEAERKREDEEDEQRKRKEEEEAERKRKEEEEEQRKRKEEEEEERKKKDEEAKRKRKEEEEEEAEMKKKEEAERKRKEEEEAERKRRRGSGIIFRYPHCPDEFQLGRGKDDNRSYIRDLMFGGTLDGYDNFLSFKDIRNLLFARESEYVIIDCYMDDLRSYMKGKNKDAENWSLRYPDQCPQQGSGDDCAIFTCKYMECLARRDTQGLPFSRDDMPNVRAKFALHFIKAYYNAQERSN
ncbi:hypothetical protein Taro_013159 [Colocasia esculenta]|uniref:Ubiquitin-like protease family profile domain-containing protein n=1 Tax=Colocasia esculenta TaxID=4460 RepID=A0A843UAT6_COLES|nr:hypothetical protein [Colocasia esculenta]